ncbi:hypothetical protein BDD12DRAFT_868381 [Trichophaea hybrida]|nr:hypothetical protein BDD12DRAFT_868381 [Trichophaea hybrida]
MYLERSKPTYQWELCGIYRRLMSSAVAITIDVSPPLYLESYPNLYHASALRTPSSRTERSFLHFPDHRRICSHSINGQRSTSNRISSPPGAPQQPQQRISRPPALLACNELGRRLEYPSVACRAKIPPAISRRRRTRLRSTTLFMKPARSSDRPRR